jgi:hypothetical protein
MAVDPIELNSEDSKRLREEAERRGVAPEKLAHDAVVEFLNSVRERFPFVATVTASREGFRARDADKILESEGFGRS